MYTQQVVQRAADNRTVIPAFNIPYLPMVKPVIQAIKDENTIAMVQVARLEWEKFEAKSLFAVADEYYKYSDPVHTLLHLDHIPVIDEDNRVVDYMPIIEDALKAGYGSVMVDGSRLPLEDNIAATAAVSEKAHAVGVAVEAELGAVAGHEAGGLGMSYEELFASKKGFTEGAEALRFSKESGCDWLSIAAGNIHGAIAESTRKEKKPEARLDIEHIANLYEATSHMPLVLHGGSGIKQEYILKAVANGVAKINVATEIRQPYELALEKCPGDIEYAREQVYLRTRWVLHEFLQITDNKTKIFG